MRLDGTENVCYASVETAARGSTHQHAPWNMKPLGTPSRAVSFLPSQRRRYVGESNDLTAAKQAVIGRQGEEGGLPPFPVTVPTPASTDPASVRAAHRAQAPPSLSCSMLAYAVTGEPSLLRPSCS